MSKNAVLVWRGFETHTARVLAYDKVKLGVLGRPAAQVSMMVIAPVDAPTEQHERQRH